MYRKHDAWWLNPDQYPISWHAILGSLVMKEGAFHVYQWLGQHTPTGDRLSPPPGERPGGSWIYPRYLVRFESDALGTLEVWPFGSSIAPDVADICRATGNWLTEVKHSLSVAQARLRKEVDPAIQQLIRDALAQREVYYQAVYNAWIALGCAKRKSNENEIEEEQE